MEFVYDSLDRNMHTSSLLEVIFLGTGIAPLVPPAQRSRYHSCFWVDALSSDCPGISSMLLLAEHKTREQSVRKDKEKVSVCGHQKP